MFQSPTPYDRFVDEGREDNQENIPSSAESSLAKHDIVMEATPRKHKPVVIIDVTLNDQLQQIIISEIDTNPPVLPMFEEQSGQFESDYFESKKLDSVEVLNKFCEKNNLSAEKR